MLVLTRKQQEQIHIGDNITITVVRIHGNSVRIGIEAPQSVRVLRGEVATREALQASLFPLVAAQTGAPATQRGEREQEAAGVNEGQPTHVRVSPFPRPGAVLSASVIAAHAV